MGGALFRDLFVRRGRVPYPKHDIKKMLTRSDQHFFALRRPEISARYDRRSVSCCDRHTTAQIVAQLRRAQPARKKIAKQSVQASPIPWNGPCIYFGFV